MSNSNKDSDRSFGQEIKGKVYLIEENSGNMESGEGSSPQG